MMNNSMFGDAMWAGHWLRRPIIRSNDRDLFHSENIAKQLAKSARSYGVVAMQVPPRQPQYQWR